MEYSKSLFSSLAPHLRPDALKAWHLPSAWLVTGGIILSASGWMTWAGWKTFYRKGRDLRFDSMGLTRPLSDIEQWYSMRNMAEILPNISFVLLLTGTPWSPQETERRARLAMINHAPSMCTIVDHDLPDHQAQWKRLWSNAYEENQQGILDVREEVRLTESHDDSTWMSLCERLEREGFHPNEHSRYTLFKIAVVSRAGCEHWELVFLAHHSVFDAYGAQRFLNAMLSANSHQTLSASGVVQEEAGGQDTSGSNLARKLASSSSVDLENVVFEGVRRADRGDLDIRVNWPKPLEQLLNANLNWNLWSRVLLPYYVPLVRKLFPWYYRGQPSKVWVGPANREGVVLSKPTTGTLWIKVGAEELAKLHKNGKSRGVTINSALWSAAMFALMKMHFELSARPNSEAQSGSHPWAECDVSPSDALAKSSSAYSKDHPLALALQNPVDFRKFCSTDQSHNWSPLIAAVHTEYTLSKEDGFWNVASQIQQLLKDKTAEALAQLGFIKHVPAPRVRWVLAKDAIGHNGRITTMGITNAGRVDFEDALTNSKLKLRDAWFVRHGMKDGTLFSVHVITPGQDRDMNLMITYAKELVSDEDAQRMTDTILEIIRLAGISEPANTDFNATQFLKHSN
jgi:hypothetical protein